MTQEPEVSNISSWRLNKSEQKELAERVAKGECEKTAKKDIQRRKAIANENRKKAAQAVASKAAVPKASAKKKSPATIAAQAAAQETPKDQTNAAYYAEVEADIQAIMKEFSGIENELPLPVSAAKGPGTESGVQEPYQLENCQAALEKHGVYRCSIPLFWLNLVSSATPGIPMSRRRVLDLCAYYYPQDSPAFMTGRCVEVLVEKSSLTATPSLLQQVSPEELIHSLLASCAKSILLLGLN